MGQWLNREHDHEPPKALPQGAGKEDPMTTPEKIAVTVTMMLLTPVALLAGLLLLIFLKNLLLG